MQNQGTTIRAIWEARKLVRQPREAPLRRVSIPGAAVQQQMHLVAPLLVILLAVLAILDGNTSLERERERNERGERNRASQAWVWVHWDLGLGSPGSGFAFAGVGDFSGVCNSKLIWVCSDFSGVSLFELGVPFF